MWSIGGIHSIPVIADSLASLSKFRDTKVLKYEVVTLPGSLIALMIGSCIDPCSRL